jgi:hypothetical protein
MATAPPGNKNINFDKSEAVTLIIGEEKHEMIVHATHISKNSEFFKTALKDEWLEGQTRTIHLPVEDCETMRDYLNFTYNGKLPTTGYTEEGEFTWDGCIYAALMEIYTLGDRLMDIVVRNAVIEEIVRIYEIQDYPPDQDSIDIIYQGTCGGDPARRLMTDMYIKWARDCADGKPDPPFVLDVAQDLLTRLNDAEALERMYRYGKLKRPFMPEDDLIVDASDYLT